MRKSNTTSGTRNTILISVVGLISAVSPTSVFAQSNEAYFDGLSLGAQAGWEESKIDATVLPETLNVDLADKNDGFTYGLIAGYDHQIDNFVIGAEASFSPNGQTLNAPIATGGSIELDSKWSADFTLRAGVAVSPRLLAYGRFGYSLNRYRIRGFAPGTSAPVANESETADGITFGGGFEYALNRNVSVRTEYRRHELDGSLSSNQVLGGVTFRF